MNESPKCPICGKLLIVGKREYKYKRDWLPFIKTYRMQTTYLMCNNDNFKTEEKEIAEDGIRKKVFNVTVPCPNYCGNDLGDTSKAVIVEKVKTE